MRVLILNTDYEPFIENLYIRNSGLDLCSYEEQVSVRNKTLFGVANFYSGNLRKLGHEAWDIYANNQFMQTAWAGEHGLRVDQAASAHGRGTSLLRRVARLAARTPVRYLRSLLRPFASSWNGTSGWFYTILAAQIRHFQPDVLLNQAMDGISHRFLSEMKKHVRLLAGQIASPLPRGEKFGSYDLVLSSLPNFVDFFRQEGISSELNRLGFEPAVLDVLDGRGDNVPVSFVGSFTSYHDDRIRLLEHLCTRSKLEIWGQGIESLPKDSPIIQNYKGTAWGIEMYRILRRSNMTLNHHIQVANSYANNMRLFEATGVGTMLVTDWKANLHEMFEPGREAVAYHTPEECEELIRYYLEHDTERRAIARAGQERTLRDHTYYRRMEELAAILGKYL